MKHNFFISFLVLFLLFSFLSGPALGVEVQEFSLDNGMKVFMVEDHKSPLAIFQVWYRVGSRNEVSGKTGLSHLLEHMMFKGTKKYGSKELSQRVQRHGGMDNAFTSKDYTAYYQILPSDQIELSLDFESDRMRNILMEPQETMAERDVVMEERRLRTEDDPQGLLYELTIASAFSAHPYRTPVIGWMSDLENIDREDLWEHYRAYYSPDNAFIVVVGDIEPEALIRKIRAYFGPIQPNPPPRRHITEEPGQSGERRVYLKKEAQLPYVMAAYHVPSLPHPDTYALDVLSMVLAGGKSGRLYQKLVYEERISVGTFASYASLFTDPYLFLVGGTATPGTEAADIEAALYRELDRLKEEPPTEFEVQKAKNQLEADFIMSMDSISYLAGLVARFEIVGGWKLMNEYVGNIRKVTQEDVSRVARKYFTEENRTVGELIPVPPKEQAQEKAQDEN
jgi:zinc protease